MSFKQYHWGHDGVKECVYMCTWTLFSDKIRVKPGDCYVSCLSTFDYTQISRGPLEGGQITSLFSHLKHTKNQDKMPRNFISSLQVQLFLCCLYKTQFSQYVLSEASPSPLNSCSPSPESNQFSSNQYKRCCTCCPKERCWPRIRCSRIYPPLMSVSRCAEGWMSLSNITCEAKLRSPPQTKCCWTRPVRVNWRLGVRPFGLKCWWY